MTTTVIALVWAALFILSYYIIDGIFTRLHKLEEALAKPKLEDSKKAEAPVKPAAANDLWKLEKELSSQRRFLNDIHVVLQQARMMPYAPTHTPPNLLKGASDISSLYGPSKICIYDVVALKNGQIIGYLATTGIWTLDPMLIMTTPNEAEAKALCSKAVLAEGLTAKIRGHATGL